MKVIYFSVAALLQYAVCISHVGTHDSRTQSSSKHISVERRSPADNSVPTRPEAIVAQGPPGLTPVVQNQQQQQPTMARPGQQRSTSSRGGFQPVQPKVAWPTTKERVNNPVKIEATMKGKQGVHVTTSKQEGRLLEGSWHDRWNDEQRTKQWSDVRYVKYTGHLAPGSSVEIHSQGKKIWSRIKSKWDRPLEAAAGKTQSYSHNAGLQTSICKTVTGCTNKVVSNDINRPARAVTRVQGPATVNIRVSNSPSHSPQRQRPGPMSSLDAVNGQAAINGVQRGMPEFRDLSKKPAYPMGGKPGTGYPHPPRPTRNSSRRQQDPPKGSSEGGIDDSRGKR